MTKINLSLLFIVFLSISCFAQKPKKTYDHEKFAKKAVMSMAYIEKMCLDEAGIKYVVSKNDVSREELEQKLDQNLAALKEDIDYILENQIFGAQKSIELTNIRETPLKMADIVVNYTSSSGSFQYVLKNCVQTNISWYMGDGIEVRGDAVAGLLKKKEEKSAPGGLLAKIKDLEEKEEKKSQERASRQAYIDSLNATRRGFVGPVYNMVGTDPSSRYFQHGLVGRPLRGFYVKNDGTLVNAVIAYQKPEFMVGKFAESSKLFICKQANDRKVDLLNPDNEPNFKEYVSKSDIIAFGMEGQVFKRVENVGWRVLMSEGAIHTFVNIVKLGQGNGANYQAFIQTQKLDGEVYGSVIKGASKDDLFQMMRDYPELADNFFSGNLGELEAIIQYNKWYDEKNPGAVKYLPLR